MPAQQKIGDYTIVKTVGSGSFGKVKKAVHDYTKQVVALKIISRNKLTHSDMAGRVNREIQYLKMLRHPHIIKLYEVISTPVDIIMVMEFAGGELFNYLVEKGRMPEPDARRFFQQIISAIEYSHRRGIVHRDLKPENLLLDAFDNVKIADFGLSNIIKDGEFLKTSCGSPNYAAPEVINGKLYAGPDVDVWSCGVILYVMLCGKLPFDDDNIPALFKKISSGMFIVPSYVSPDAKALIHQMLKVDPINRITISEIRKNKWFNIGLPDYLQPLPEGVDPMQLEVVNNDIVNELVAKLDLSRTEIVSSLRSSGYNHVKVSYQLLLDNKHMVEMSKLSDKTGIKNFAMSSSPPAWNAISATVLLNQGTPLDSPFLRQQNNPFLSKRASDDDINTRLNDVSSVSVLGSSIPKNNFMKMNENKLNEEFKGQIIPGKVKIEHQSNITRAVLANNAARNSPQIPSKLSGIQSPQANGDGVPTRVPSNYFRASLPKLPPSITNSRGSSAASPNTNSSIESIKRYANDGSNKNLNEGNAIPIHPMAGTGDSGSIGANIKPGGEPSSVSNSLGSNFYSNQLGNDSRNPSAKLSNSFDPRGVIGPSPLSGSRSSKDPSKTRPRWHFGIRSKSQPSEVMNEIYKTLISLGMKWKAFDPYHIRIKYVHRINEHQNEKVQTHDQDLNRFGSSSNADSIFSTGVKRKSNYNSSVYGGAQSRNSEKQNFIETKVDLQLYRVDQRNYLVDFRAVVPASSATKKKATSESESGTLPLIPDPIDVASVNLSLSKSLSKSGAGLKSLYHNQPSIANVNFESLRVSEATPHNSEFRSGIQSQNQAQVQDQDQNQDMDMIFDSEMDVTMDHESKQANQISNILKDIEMPDKLDSNAIGGKPLPTPASLPGFENILHGSTVQSLPKHDVPDTLYNQNQEIIASANSKLSSGIAFSLKHDLPSATPMNILGKSHTGPSGSHIASSFRNGSASNQQEIAKGLAINKTSANSSGQVFNIFPFFDVCSKLISKLAVPPQKN